MASPAAPDWVKTILDLLLYLLLAGAAIGAILVVCSLFKGKTSVAHLNTASSDEVGFIRRLRSALGSGDLVAMLVLVKQAFFRIWLLYVVVLLLLILYGSLSYKRSS